jgi:hypothetical protein
VEKQKNITSSESEFVAVFIQHAKGLRRIVNNGPSGSAIFFHMV